MRRSALLALGLVSGAAFFSACRDATVATVDPTSTALTVPSISFDELASSSTGVTHWVTIDPRRETVYSDGINSVRIPAGAICDHATSSYGPAHWDAPCTAATSPITLPVTVSVYGEGVAVHFGMDLRFAPTSDPAKQVVLVVDASKVTAAAPSAAWNIFWIPSGTTTAVDEGATDPALATKVQSDSRLVRRLKHFSGYYAHLGFNSDVECDPEVDEGCVPRDE